jgi:NAD(P)-dependent dehydrogenase (short-subunit alcohol dehydrogenase family)
MDLGLQDRVALVVGGTGYIGTAIAARLLAEGASVVLGGRDRARLDAAIAALGAEGRVAGVVIDTTDDAAVRSAVAEAAAIHDRLDVLVTTAAPPAQTLDRAHDDDPAQIIRAIDEKAMGALRCANAALPFLRAGGFGRIVTISGQNADLTGSMTGASRNAAVRIWSKTLADRTAGTGITVNVVDPGGVVDDPSGEPALAQAGLSSPEQIAALVAFLASVPGAAVSGESIAVGHRVLGVQ